MEIQKISSKVMQFLSQPGEAWKAACLSAPEGERLLSRYYGSWWGHTIFQS